MSRELKPDNGSIHHNDIKIFLIFKRLLDECFYVSIPIHALHPNRNIDPTDKKPLHIGLVLSKPLQSVPKLPVALFALCQDQSCA